jgi:hypothetical protein
VSNETEARDAGDGAREASPTASGQQFAQHLFQSKPIGVAMATGTQPAGDAIK